MFFNQCVKTIPEKTELSKVRNFDFSMVQHHSQNSFSSLVQIKISIISIYSYFFKLLTYSPKMNSNNTYNNEQHQLKLNKFSDLPWIQQDTKPNSFPPTGPTCNSRKHMKFGKITQLVSSILCLSPIFKLPTK